MALNHVVDAELGAFETRLVARGADYVIEDHRIRGLTVFPPSSETQIWSPVKPVVCELSVGERRHPRRVYHAGDLRLIGPNLRVTRQVDEEATLRSLTLSRRLLRQTLGASAEMAASDFARLQRLTFRSRVISAVTEQLAEPAAQRGEAGPGYADALLQAVTQELKRLSGAGHAAPRGALSAAALSRLNRFIDARLCDKLQLADLAAALDMPLTPFKQAIKRTTGLTAYQHLTHRRLAAARQMLEHSTESVAQIAFQTGFASQSHMTDVFKAKLGATPGRLRCARRRERS